MPIRYVKNENVLYYWNHPHTPLILIPVNCVGVMGKGLALEFKQRFPHMFNEYKNICKHKELRPGEIITLADVTTNKEFCMFPTKDHWKDPSKVEYIDKGMDDLVKYINRQRDLEVVLIPKLGCGLGGLDWLVVKPIIIQKVKTCKYFDDIEFIIYE